MISPAILRRFRCLNLPGALLVLLLQRTPALRLFAVAEEAVVGTPWGTVLRATLAGAAALGGLHTLAGATEFVINRNPVIGTVGQAISPVSFTYNGAPSSPGSFRVTGTLAPGLRFIPELSAGVVNSATPVIVGTPTQGGEFQIEVQGFDSPGGNGLTNDVLVTILFSISGGVPTSPPSFTTQPVNQVVGAGTTATLTAAASGNPTFQWQRNGVVVANATGSTLGIANVQPENAGIYQVVASNGNGTATSQPAIMGMTTTQKVLGAGEEIGSNIPHPNLNIFDQVLLKGSAVAVQADPGQVTRTSFIDSTDDIVQVEFSGPGTVSIIMDTPGIAGPPVRYNQPTVSYIKGHAGIVVSGATEASNISVFSVGRATAFDPTGNYNILQAPGGANNPANNGSSLFAGHSATIYDGMADIAYIAISSIDGKFGGIRTANASYFATRGITGIYAPGVQFTGPVFVGDINAFDAATPMLVVGSVANSRITGGDLQQSNGRVVQVAGLTQLVFAAGSDSHGTLFAAKTNQAVLEQRGVNVTSQVVVNP